MPYDTVGAFIIDMYVRPEYRIWYDTVGKFIVHMHPACFICLFDREGQFIVDRLCVQYMIQ